MKKKNKYISPVVLCLIIVILFPSSIFAESPVIKQIPISEHLDQNEKPVQQFDKTTNSKDDEQEGLSEKGPRAVDKVHRKLSEKVFDAARSNILQCDNL